MAQDRRACAAAAALLAALATPATAQTEADPVLALGDATVAPDTFARIVSAAVARHPSLAEAGAAEREAAGARLEALGAQLPVADLSFNSSYVLARKFSNDPDNVLERSRANSRTDLTATVNQPLIDFGASRLRVGAASARLRAAAAGIEATADQSALSMIAAWYDVYTYRALVSLAELQAEQQRGVRGDLKLRIERGYSADGDLLRVDSALAATAARNAAYRRNLANAEARFVELSGGTAPAGLGRAPAAATGVASAAAARDAADRNPVVRAAAEQAAGAQADARAARADRYPNVVVGVDAGRYGVFEDREDYDVRARVTVRQRFAVAPIARSRQYDARAIGAAAKAQRVRQEAERDAAIAFSDTQTLEGQIDALKASYLAAHQSRLMLTERFRLARGTLLDVMDASNAEFGAAIAYVEGLGERDAARYALLSRTGGLLAALGIDAGTLARGEGRR